MERKDAETIRKTLKEVLKEDRVGNKLNYIITLLAVISTLCIFIIFSLFMLAE